ncbi:hydantoinase B/oxoprolinase family protein [Agrobacterium salinitolerans]|uniref:hydantoinase B/oxoprolinase family protein n=1 Tax=Agrobacterium salinitolerans TaxID=1183413 RepID=UPI001574C62F|nr:hydantoinase B/oxoprolinase family protein [Agrobacterium salinitolerans]NTA40258.1 hydantoinase B/oxoprolinase family protein [Agrobacterium salinitolerans]
MLTRNQKIDPITFEVVRNKLQAITEEQAITLRSASGSPVVTDATDFNNGLYLADGSIVTMGPQVIFHTGTMSTVIRSILENYSDNPGINEGDMFILNDPYRGGLHQPDMSIVAPIFFEGRHVAWAGTCAHELDVGGMSFGSWALGSTEIQQEAMLLPGIKLVEKGTLRQDLWQMIMGMSRLPDVIGLDLKAMIAANNVAVKRLTELMTRYGVSQVEQIMREEIDATEKQFRAILSELPDGVYRARDYIEHDGHTNALYEVCVAATKTGDSLIIDFEGTSPQAPGFINCTRSGMRGAAFAGLLPILAPTLRWNEGVIRSIEFRAPEGILCNATRPAPVSAATISAAWIVQNVVVTALSRMVSFSEKYADEGQAVTKGHMMVMTLAGKDRDGGLFGTFLLDATAGGGGAYRDHDGLDGSGDHCVPRPAITNVESSEASGPYIYLYRSFVPDTGGPGRTRGGTSTSLAIAPYETDGLNAMLVGHGIEVPNSVGLFGGRPGACGRNFVHRNAGDSRKTAAMAGNLADMVANDVEDLGPKPGRFFLSNRDVLGYSFQGGGGYGDPLKRDPALVLSDVVNNHVSVEAARSQYGVVILNGDVDQPGTDKERQAIRRRRLGGTSPAKSPAEGDILARNGRFVCSCGCDLGSVDRDWKERSHSVTVAASEMGEHIRTHEDLELREFYCEDCGSLLESEVVRRDEPSLASFNLVA